MFSDVWEWVRLGAVRLERRYPASVLLTGSGVALLAVSELADRLEHGLSAKMTFLVVSLVPWLLALGWRGMRRVRPWMKRVAVIGWLRNWILPVLVMLCAALILLAVVGEHLSAGAGPDALLAMTGATFVLIAQIIARVGPENNGN
jgi:hypothetical protein